MLSVEVILFSVNLQTFDKIIMYTMTNGTINSKEPILQLFMKTIIVIVLRYTKYNIRYYFQFYFFQYKFLLFVL